MLAAVILALGACSHVTPKQPSAPGGAVAVPLARFYDQKLTFGSCKGYATTDADAKTFANDTFECARLEVPLDYENSGGRTAQIALLRVPAKGEPSKRIGSLLLNPGGPGFSGMSHAPLVTTVLGEHPITQQFDLIGFDPRGVAASTPALDCFANAQREADMLVNTLNSGGRDPTEDETRQLYKQCAERSGGEDVLAHVGTRDVARDMDVPRGPAGMQTMLGRAVSHLVDVKTDVWRHTLHANGRSTAASMRCWTRDVDQHSTFQGGSPWQKELQFSPLAGKNSTNATSTRRP